MRGIYLYLYTMIPIIHVYAYIYYIKFTRQHTEQNSG